MNSEDKLVEALKRADADPGDRETLQGMVAGMMRNQSRALQIMPWAITLGSMALAVFAAVEFFRAVDTKALLLYATLFLTALIFIAISKI